MIGGNYSQLKLPENCHICCIARHSSREIIFDINDKKIQLDDILIIFISDREHLNAIEKIFKLEDI